MHHSIIQVSVGHKVERCTACCKLFHCPLCPKYKPSQRARLQQHLDVHIKNAITFKDKKICKCNLNCRTGGHFHCPICGKTIIKRSDMEKHLEACQGATKKISTTAAAPIQAESTSQPDTAAASSPLLLPSTLPQVSLISESVVPPPQQGVPPAQLTSATTSSGDTHATAQDIKIQASRWNKVQCPHCKLVCHKKNLNKHIQRKHIKKKSTTACYILKNVCVDATNGISAVQRTTHGFSVPIHVQKKTWGHQHKVQCELEDCRQYHLMAARSGLPFSQCDHIRSLEHCSEMASEEWLKEEVSISEYRKAAEWVATNQHLFSDKVELPCVITMGEEEQVEAVQQYDRLWVADESCMIDDLEKEAILEPFKFKFYKMEDMRVFCEEIADRRGYLAYAECHIED